ncbi:MAG: septum site-determining protein MinC [Gammaproteobacteria bacterium]
MSATMSQTPNAELPSVAFQLKGSLFTLTVLHLINIDIGVFSSQLEALTHQAPKFFKHAPVVIDLQKLAIKDITIDFTSLVEELRRKHMIPVGIRSGSPQQQADALEAGLAILPEAKTESSLTTSATTTTATTTPSRPSYVAPLSKQNSKVITQPVRSGQQIYAQGGDLIVLAPVSSGAELLADGHIHVYAPLRGRALAGVTGDQTARIFCHSLEAELISIAGHYWVKEDIKSSTERQTVHIYLEDERLQLTSLS